MAVQKSPFAPRRGEPPTPPRRDPNAFSFDLPSGVGGGKSIIDVSGATPSFASTSNVKKSTFEEEKRQLDKALRTLQSRIRGGGSSNFEKLSAAAEAIAAGNKPEGLRSKIGDFVGGFLGKVIAPVGLQSKESKESIAPAIDALGTPKRAVQSLYDFALGTPVGNLYELARGKDWKDLEWDSVGEAYRRTFDPNWSLSKDKRYQTGNKWVDRAAGLVYDIGLDPLTYVGAGATKYAGRAGREALALRFGSTEMLTKYPELAGKLDDIVRYGEWAIPKNIRDAEGIQSGIRFAGRILDNTEEAGLGVKKLIADLRAPLGDAIYSKFPVVQSSLVPKSIREGVAYGVGRGLGTSDKDVLTRIGNTSAQRFAKGATTTSYQEAVQKIKGNIKEVRDIAKTLPDGEAGVYALVEDKVAREVARASGDATKQRMAVLADQFQSWQDELLETVNAERRAFADKFGVDITEIRAMDEDYLHHAMTGEAKRWIRGKGARSGLWKPEELMFDDIRGEIGAARYRKLRAGEEFMGETLKSGTIKEINEISRAKIGIDWFETDLGSIADSYAYSMAKARGRAAYAKRLMDFGPEYIKPMIDKAVPDPQLVSGLDKAHKLLVREAVKLRERVAIRSQDVRDVATRARGMAQAALNKNYAARKATSAEIRKTQEALAEIDRLLIAARKEAESKTSEQRGAFDTAFEALLNMRNRVAAAVERDDAAKFAITEEMKRIYAQVFPTRKNIPDNIEVMAEDILRRQGVPTSRELVEARARERALLEQLDQLDVGDVSEEARQAIVDELESIREHIDGFSKLADVRLEADYAPDGFLYGTVDDVVPIDPDVAIQPYKVLRPYRTPQLADPEAVAIVAPATDSMLDLRKAEDVRLVFGDDNTISALGQAMEDVGLNGEGFLGEWDNFLRTGEIDPMFVELYPEQAALIKRLDDLRTLNTDGGPVPLDVIRGQLDALENDLTGVAYALAPEDSDIVGGQLMDEMLGGAMFFNEGRGIVVPAGFVDRNMPFDDDAVAIIMPTSYGNKQPRSGGAAYATDEVQLVNDSTFVQRILGGDYESGSLEAQTAFDSLADELMNTELGLEARTALDAELRGATKRRAGLEGAATKRANKAAANLDEFRKTGKVRVTIDGKRKTVTADEARKIVADADKQYAKGERALEKAIETTQKELGIPQLLKKQAKLEERLPMLFNQAEVLQQWNETTGELLRNEIDNLNTIIKQRPPKGAAGMQTVIWQRKVERAVRSLGQLDEITGKAYQRITTQLHADEVRLAWLDTVGLPKAVGKLKAAEQGKIGATMIQTTEKGWEAVAGLGVQVPEEMARLWKPQLDALKDPTVLNKMFDGYDWYLRFFKTYATSSYGFSVRNAMSATFMNYVAGVDTANIVEGARVAWAIRQHGDQWIEKLGLPEARKELYRQAWQATEATGRGFGDELAMPVANSKLSEKIINNPYTRHFRNINDFVERAVRMPMALDSFNRGFTYDEAVARIARYHFDYSDMSTLDEAAKRIVPFWIWTSRNVPLQFASMVTRPQAYATYDKIRETYPPDADILMPQWLSSLQPIGLGGKNLLAFDLPFGRLEQTTKNILSLEGLLSQASPLVKVPIEVAVADKQVGLGVPFTDKWEKARGIDALMAKLGAVLGQDWLGKQTEDGLLVNPKASYSVSSMIPLIAKIERLSGGKLGGKANYADRVLASWLNEIGIPYKNAGPYERGEAINRQFNLKDFATKLEEQGKIRKKP